MGFFGFIQAGLSTIGHIAQGFIPSFMAINQTRALTTQSRSLELAQKRDDANREVALKRMKFDAKMAIFQQAARAKERQEEQEFSRQLQESRQRHEFAIEASRQAFQSLEAEKQRQFMNAIEKFKAEVQLAINQDNLAFARWKEETGREFTREMKLLDVQLAQILTKEKRENDRRDRNSPVFSVADDILAGVARYPQMPLSVFISPPVLLYDPAPQAARANAQFPAMEEALSSSLRDLFKQYSQRERPIRFLAGEWVTKSRRAESAANDIFRDLGTVPVMILETAVEESFLHLNVGFWHTDFPAPRFETVVRKHRWQDIINEIANERAKTWQAQERSLANDYDKAEFIRRNREDLTHYLEVLHCLHAGMVADEYFLLFAEPRQLPLLPQLLPDLLAELPPEAQTAFTQQVIDYCEQLFAVLDRVEPEAAAALHLAWATILRDLPSRYGFEAQLGAAMRAWLAQRGVSLPQADLATLAIAVGERLIPEDAAFVTTLNGCLQVLPEAIALNIATSCYQRSREHIANQAWELARIDCDRTLSLSPHADAYYQRSLAYLGLEQYREAVADADRVIQLQPNRAEAYAVRGNAYAQLGDYETALANYNEAIAKGATHLTAKRDQLQAWWQDHRRRELADQHYQTGMQHWQAREYEQALAAFQQAAQYGHPEAMQTRSEVMAEQERCKALIFKLPNDGGDLEFVWIKAGTLKLGEHEIHLAAFRMSKYPITQRQYQAIMGNNPSHFKGDLDCPVETVYWQDAVKFCEELSKQPVMAGQTVRLPSEAQWEYACRAGTPTKFWFGDSDSELAKHAWYSGNSGDRTHSVYEKAKEHENPWGLVDMHGNVWEWCQDNWTSNTNELPKDGTPLLTSGPSGRHAVRGGSWNDIAVNCASGNRNYWGADSTNNRRGFRVVLLV